MPQITENLVKQSGVSLIELLLGLTLSVILIIISGHIFVNNTRTIELINSEQQLQNTALYAQHYLSRHIQHSAYIGDTVPSARFIGTALSLNGNSCNNADWTTYIQQPLTGTNQDQPQYPCLLSGTSIGWLTGDTITVRYSHRLTTKKYFKKTLYTRSSLSTVALFLGEDRNAPENKIQPPYSTRQFNSYTFYISRSRLQWCDSTNPPALATMVRSRSGKLRRSIIVAGIEQLQIQYSSNLINYVDANQVSNWKNIKSSKIWMLVRSLCKYYKQSRKRYFRFADIELNFNDRHRRKLFSFIVAFRNESN